MQFLKDIRTNFHTKVAQIFDDVWARYFKNVTFGHLDKIGLIFIPTSGHTESILTTAWDPPLSCPFPWQRANFCFVKKFIMEDDFGCPCHIQSV